MQWVVTSPAVVLAEFAAAVIPMHVPSMEAQFMVMSFAAAVLAVKITVAPVPDTIKNALTSASAARTVRALPATNMAVSAIATATEIAFPAARLTELAAVIVKVAFPAWVIVATTVAVSTCRAPCENEIVFAA